MLRLAAIPLVFAASLRAFAQQSAPLLPESKSPGTSSASAAASLQISGLVTVNQRLVTELASSVLKQDRIETASSAAARISARSLSLYPPANSCLTFGGREFELCNCGSVDVNAGAPAAIGTAVARAASNREKLSSFNP